MASDQIENEFFLLTEPAKEDDYMPEVLGYTVPQASQILLEALANVQTSENGADLIQSWFDEGLDKPARKISDEYDAAKDEIELDKYWLSLINRLFGGRLNPDRIDFTMILKDNNVTIEQWGKSWAGKLGRSRTWLEVEDYPWLPDDLWIRIDIVQRPNVKNNDERMLGYIGTLVHELVHAYFRFYCCECEACMPRVRSIDEYGIVGHGTVWQRVAYAVEKFCVKTLKIDIDLHRSNAYVAEACKSKTGIDKALGEELELNIGAIKAYLEARGA
jgi:hypothetical protein